MSPTGATKNNSEAENIFGLTRKKAFLIFVKYIFLIVNNFSSLRFSNCWTIAEPPLAVAESCRPFSAVAHFFYELSAKKYIQENHF
jgi:hypothetical protein